MHTLSFFLLLLTIIQALQLNSEREATFTYTNAAPQYPGFNRGYWKDLEEMVKRIVATDCAETFFITGVAPGKSKRYLNLKSGFFDRGVI